MAKDKGGHGSEKRGAAGGQLTPGTKVVQTMGIRQNGITMKPFDYKQSTDGTYKAPGPNDHPVQWDNGTKGYAASVHLAPAGSPAAQPPRDPTPAELAAQHGISTSHLAPAASAAQSADNPRYNRGAVQNAINSSRQKIGGREASLIHRLLSGGH